MAAEIPVRYPTDIALTPDGSRAYVTLYDDKVVTIDLASNAVASTVPVKNVTGGVAISADGRRAYVGTSLDIAKKGDGPISVIDTASNNVIASIPSPIRNDHIAVSPDGRRLYLAGDTFAGVRRGVAVVDTP